MARTFGLLLSIGVLVGTYWLEWKLIGPPGSFWRLFGFTAGLGFAAAFAATFIVPMGYASNGTSGGLGAWGVTMFVIALTVVLGVAIGYGSGALVSAVQCTALLMGAWLLSLWLMLG